jgi:secreted trypsin-like serine protease
MRTSVILIVLLSLVLLVVAQERIYNGEEAPEGSYPYVAELANMVMGGLVMQTFCGGAILNMRYVLTAAHCFEDNNSPDYMVVVVGEHDLTQIKKTYQVNRIIVHPQWSSKTLSNDIALVELDEDVFETDNIKYIKLADNAPAVGTLLDIAGWGRTTDLTTPLTMRHAQIELQADGYCAMFFGAFSKLQICAGGKGHDPCKGDSGTSLTYQDQGSFYSVGIVSFGAEQCDGAIPAAFTKVPAYIPWIQSNIPLINPPAKQFNSTIYTRDNSGTTSLLSYIAVILSIIAVVAVL